MPDAALDMRICIVIPAYNAAATLGTLLTVLETHSPDILVVDDGSQDETHIVASRFPDVHCIRFPMNRGKSAALRAGFQWAIDNGYDAAVTMDSDLQHDPDDLPGLIETFQRRCPALLIGSRMHDLEDMPKARRFGNRFSSAVASAFCHQPIQDSQCGFRVYDLHACKDVLLGLRMERFASESEVLLRIALARLRILSAPIQVIYPPGPGHTSNYRPFADTSRIVGFYLMELARRWCTPRGRKQAKEARRYAQSLGDRAGVNVLAGPRQTADMDPFAER